MFNGIIPSLEKFLNLSQQQQQQQEEDDDDEEGGGKRQQQRSTTTTTSKKKKKRESIIINNNKDWIQNPEAKYQQINYALRIFFKILSSVFANAPIVISLDDLQWADKASIDLIKSLLIDKQHITKLMFIGCYRSASNNNNSNNNNNDDDDDECDNSEAEAKQQHYYLSRTIRSLKENNNSHTNLTEIELGNLDIHAANQVLMTLLSIDDGTKTIPLAKICHKRTLGNVFFLIQFIVMLNETGLLEFNMGLFQWRWDIATIERKTAVSDNVVNIVKDRMKKLPNEFGQFLQIAALLGFKFHERTLSIAYNNNGNNNMTIIHDFLKLAVSCNFIEMTENECTYLFLHDQIQEAAASLIPRSHLTQLKYDVGMALVNELPHDDLLDNEIFVVVNLLNDRACQLAASEEEVDDDIQVTAKLNLLAAEKAQSLSAYHSTAKYAKIGISMLPKDSWTDNFDITLRLYSIGAVAAGFLGRVEEMQEYCNQVLDQSTCSIFDKIRVYTVLMDSLANRGKCLDSLNIGLTACEQLGCRFPRSPALQAAQALRFIWKLRRQPLKTEEEIKSLPKLTDPRKLECLKLFFPMCRDCYYSHQFLLNLLIIERSNQWTLKYGLHEEGPAMLSTIAVVMGCALNIWDFRMTGSFAEHIEMISRSIPEKHKRRESRVIYAVATVYQWSKPPHTLTKRFLDGYTIGMQVGDTDSAMWCIFHSICIQFLVGKPLKALDNDCRAFTPQMKEVKHIEAFNLTSCMWQGILNLINESCTSTSMTGEAFGDVDEESLFEEARNQQVPIFLRHLEMMSNVLLIYFGEYERGADLSISTGNKFLKDLPGLSMGMLLSFLKGICLFAMAQTSKKGKYRRHALRTRELIHSWVRRGNPTAQHYAVLLDAEYFAMKKKLDEASKCYKEGIVMSSRGGFIHDAAIGNERYADFLLKNHQDENEAAFRAKQAIQLYQEWGATAKANTLKLKYDHLSQ